MSVLWIYHYLCALKKNIIQKKMKKRFLIVALFTLFLGGIAVAQSQEQPSTLAELQTPRKTNQKEIEKTQQTY